MENIEFGSNLWKMTNLFQNCGKCQLLVEMVEINDFGLDIVENVDFGLTLRKSTFGTIL